MSGRGMDLKIDWKKMLVISESITVILMAIVIIGLVSMYIGGSYTFNNATAILFLFTIFAMPIAGMANFIISINAQMKDSIIAICFLEALWTVVLVALVFYLLVI